MKPAIEPLALNKEELEKLLEHIRPALSDEEYKQLKAVLDTLAYLIQVVDNKNTTIHRLRQILFGASTEKTNKVLKTEEAEIEAADSNVVPPGEIQADNVESERKGHGRNGAQAYSGARKITIAHPSLKSGDRCQECKTGKLYEAAMPGLLVRVVGQAPLAATVYELEKLRCNLCGEVFTAAAPEGVGSQKYDASAAMMIALLKYGSGFPFHRLEGLQSSLGIPLPASTQWEIVEAVAGGAKPVFEELCPSGGSGRSALQRRHNDEDPGADGRRLLERGGCAAVREYAVGAQGGIYFRHRVDVRGAQDRPLLHRPQACRGELG